MAYAFNEDKSKAEIKQIRMACNNTGTMAIGAGNSAWLQFYSEDPVVFLRLNNIYASNFTGTGRESLDVQQVEVEYDADASGDFTMCEVSIKLQNNTGIAVGVLCDRSYINALVIDTDHLTVER